MFNEQYIISSAVFAPCLVVYMKKTGLDFFDEELYELAIKCVYTAFIYAVIAYKTEVRTK
jgi:hypothetical protein